jgi:hypothetical protein
MCLYRSEVAVRRVGGYTKKMSTEKKLTADETIQVSHSLPILETCLSCQIVLSHTQNWNKKHWFQHSR